MWGNLQMKQLLPGRETPKVLRLLRQSPDLLHETSNSAQMQVFLISMQILVVEVKKKLNKYWERGISPKSLWPSG